MSRCGRWQCSRVTPAGEGRGQLCSAGCALVRNSGNLPSLPCLREKWGLLQERHGFSYSFVLRLVVHPGAKLVAQNNRKQMLFQHPTVIWDPGGDTSGGGLLH